MTEHEMNMIRQTMTDLLANHTAEMNGKFNVIHSQLIAMKEQTNSQLSAIKEQTTKTNGTVIRHEAALKTLEIADATHGVKCPNLQRISDLEKSDTEDKGVRKFIIIAGSAIVGISAIITAILQLVLKD